jgi:hypothetical protein
LLAAKPDEKVNGVGVVLPPLTVKVRVTGVAGAKLLSPAWVAVRLQVPAATSVSVVPLTVHTPGVVEVIVTGRPELDVAVRVMGAVPSVWLPGEAKVIVCDAMYGFDAVAPAVLALPAMSLKLPGGTVTVIVPLTPGVGVTTMVACEPLIRLNPLAVPPVTTMSLASKLTPTSSLKTNVKVTGPAATGAETLLAIVTVGGVVSGAGPAGVLDTGGGGASASLPQPMSAAQASTRAAASCRGDRCDMAFVSAEDGVGASDDPVFMKALSEKAYVARWRLTRVECAWCAAAQDQGLRASRPGATASVCPSLKRTVIGALPALNAR